MFVSTPRSFMIALAISALAACASTPTIRSNSAAGLVDLSAYPIPSLAESEVRLLRGMSDANILGHLAAVDSLEVVTADTAIRLSKSDAVLDYARLMHAVHSDNLERDHAIGRETGITPMMIAGELKNAHLAASLDSVRIASDLTLDRHYIMSQVELHQHMLAELETLQSVATNPMVREHVASMVPVVRDHLARAHAIAVNRGFEKKRG